MGNLKKYNIVTKNLLTKLFYTLLIIYVFRLGSYISVLGIDLNSFKSAMKDNSLVGLYDMFSGGSFGNFTIFALGITPFINASIIIQLLVAGFDRLKDIQKSGEVGRKMLDRWTRYLAFVLSIVQSVGIVLGVMKPYLLKSDIFSISYVCTMLIVGSMICIFLADKISQCGVGNGTSILIFINIISRIPTDISRIKQSLTLGLAKENEVIIFVAVMVVVTILIIYISEGIRKIPIMYTKATSLRVQAKHEDFLPLKIMQSGVMPIIFASVMMAMPQTIALFFGVKGQTFIQTYFNSSTETGFWVYRVVEILLIIMFSYFYNVISFNTEDISKNLKTSGAFVPGVRLGKDTERYLNEILIRLTLFGSLFLGFISFIPSFMTHNMKLMIGGLGATSILIVIGVALEIRRNVISQIVHKSYKSFF